MNCEGEVFRIVTARDFILLRRDSVSTDNLILASKRREPIVYWHSAISQKKRKSQLRIPLVFGSKILFFFLLDRPRTLWTIALNPGYPKCKDPWFSQSRQTDAWGPPPHSPSTAVQILSNSWIIKSVLYSLNYWGHSKMTQKIPNLVWR